MRSRLALGVSILSLAASLAGCASDLEDKSGLSESEIRETPTTSSCDAAAMASATERFEHAIDLARERLSAPDRVCESEAYLSTIAYEASLAVSVCADYAGIIKTRSDAAPIREVLASSIMLRHVTNDLRARDGWAGLAESLPGVTLYGPAPGVYGTIAEVVFAADGKGKVRRLAIEGDAPTWRETDATWVAGPGWIRVTEPTGTFELELDYTNIGESDALELTIVPSDDFTPRGGFSPFPSECEA